MFWKPLLFIAPAGLMLGTIGGQLARPVMVQRAGDGAEQLMFQSRAQRYGTSGQYPTQPVGPMTYDGGYSYAPEFVDSTPADWSAPDYYHFADVPLPTLAQLDARQAALLADPEVQYASAPVDGQATLAAAPALNDAQPDATTDAAPPEQVALAPEPRTDDGALPGIW
jgi:hypothetical protein